jgi:hypothetical protein
MSKVAGIERRTVVTFVLAARRSNHSARCRPVRGEKSKPTCYDDLTCNSIIPSIRDGAYHGSGLPKAYNIINIIHKPDVPW